MWSYALLLKTRELAHYLVGNRTTMEFMTPVYEIERHDSDDIRQKILEISYADWKKQGFSKETLHQLRQNEKQINLLTSISILEKGWRCGMSWLRELRGNLPISNLPVVNLPMVN